MTTPIASTADPMIVRPQKSFAGSVFWRGFCMIKCLESDGANETQLVLTAIGDLNEHETNSGMAGTTGERGECSHPAGGLLRHHASVPPNCSPRTPDDQRSNSGKNSDSDFDTTFHNHRNRSGCSEYACISGCSCRFTGPIGLRVFPPFQAPTTGPQHADDDSAATAAAPYPCRRLPGTMCQQRATITGCRDGARSLSKPRPAPTTTPSGSGRRHGNGSLPRSTRSCLLPILRRA